MYAWRWRFPLGLADVYPYGNVTADELVVLAGRRFRLIVSGWRQYKGQHRSDMCGLAILDEDNGVIVTDCLGDSLELARELLSEICEAGLVAMVPLVNSSPRARFHLGAAGELLWKDQP